MFYVSRTILPFALKIPVDGAGETVQRVRAALFLQNSLLPSTMLGRSGQPVTPAPEDLISSLEVYRHLYSHAQANHRHAQMHIIKNNNKKL